jgi:hypothetical protein
MSEPIAAFTLAACVLGFLWASDRACSAWAWILPGFFLGLTALTRVARRQHGHSKKPAVVRYGLGFANAVLRTWLR